ncbi:MAG: hypothetical protein KQI62_21550, partial [Deltaproteobacteria bacterium]|nr:hypothetical protein [Deltaproteobacteria bacterium]
TEQEQNLTKDAITINLNNLWTSQTLHLGYWAKDLPHRPKPTLKMSFKVPGVFLVETIRITAPYFLDLQSYFFYCPLFKNVPF